LADLLDAASKAGAASSASDSPVGPDGMGRSPQEQRLEYAWVRVGVELRLTLAEYSSVGDERLKLQQLKSDVLRWMDNQFSQGILDPSTYLGNELAVLQAPGADRFKVLDVLEDMAQKRPMLRAALEKAAKEHEHKVNKGPGGDGSPEAPANEKQTKIVRQNFIGF